MRSGVPLHDPSVFVSVSGSISQAVKRGVLLRRLEMRPQWVGYARELNTQGI